MEHPVPCDRDRDSVPTLAQFELDTLHATAYDETFGRHVKTQLDGTTYVSTGDIRAEWLRDASAIVRSHIGQSLRDADIGNRHCAAWSSARPAIS